MNTALKAESLLIDDLVTANHILAYFGIVDGWGHVSVRSAERPDRFYIARSLAPALVESSDIMEFDFDARPVISGGPGTYSEIYIHSEIYRARPDVEAVVHSHSPNVLPFTVTQEPLRPLAHVSAFLGCGGVPVFEIRDTGRLASDLLITNSDLGVALAQTLGKSSISLMRGHGMVVVASTVQVAVHRAVYADVNAKEQSTARNIGAITFLNDGEAHAAMTQIESGIARPWELWKRTAKIRAD